jgi:hypothetical protein
VVYSGHDSDFCIAVRSGSNLCISYLSPRDVLSLDVAPLFIGQSSHRYAQIATLSDLILVGWI